MPVVALVSSAPIVCEALEPALAGLAAVVRVDPDQPDLPGLLASLAPSTLVVATTGAANGHEHLARAAGCPLVELSLTTPSVRVLADGIWHVPPDQRGSPEAIRNILLAAIFRRTPEG